MATRGRAGSSSSTRPWHEITHLVQAKRRFLAALAAKRFGNRRWRHSVGGAGCLSAVRARGQESRLRQYVATWVADLLVSSGGIRTLRCAGACGWIGRPSENDSPCKDLARAVPSFVYRYAMDRLGVRAYSGGESCHADRANRVSRRPVGWSIEQVSWRTFTWALGWTGQFDPVLDLVTDGIGLPRRQVVLRCSGARPRVGFAHPITRRCPTSLRVDPDSTPYSDMRWTAGIASIRWGRTEP